MHDVRKVQQFSRQLVVGIPRRLARLLDIHRGDLIAIRETSRMSFEVILLGETINDYALGRIRRGQKVPAAVAAVAPGD